MLTKFYRKFKEGNMLVIFKHKNCNSYIYTKNIKKNVQNGFEIHILV